jgi:hypothetical protein
VSDGSINIANHTGYRSMETTHGAASADVQVGPQIDIAIDIVLRELCLRSRVGRRRPHMCTHLRAHTNQRGNSERAPITVGSLTVIATFSFQANTMTDVSEQPRATNRYSPPTT